MTETGRRRLGVVLVAVAAVLWSTAGVFVRLANLDRWSIVFWRSIFTALTLGSIVVVQNRGRVVRSVTWLGIPDAVWLFYAEQPTVAAVVGALIVLASVLWYLMGHRAEVLRVR